MDLVMRHLLAQMIESVSQGDNQRSKINVLQTLATKEAAKECLLYLRDRIGVPRDMSIHAARQLRAFINYYVAQYCA